MRHTTAQFSYALGAQRTIISSVVGLALLIGLYVYCIQSAVQAAAGRERIVRGMVSLATEVVEMENAVIELRSGLTDERAASLGFVEVRSPTYVSASPHLGSAQAESPIRE